MRQLINKARYNRSLENNGDQNLIIETNARDKDENFCLAPLNSTLNFYLMRFATPGKSVSQLKKRTKLMRMKVAPKVRCQSKPCFKELTILRAMRKGLVNS